jgi:alanine dehydrogenase
MPNKKNYEHQAHLKFGLASIHAEPGERRAFLPDFVAHLTKHGGRVILEHGYGSGMGLTEDDYRRAAPSVEFRSHQKVYRQDYVLVLRCPGDDDLRLLKPGACLISMLHYPTRPQRVEFLRSLGINAISLDSLKDDSGRRLVENLRAVAWNGMEVAFQTIANTYPAPGFESPLRAPLQVTLMGAGAVGLQVVQAAIRYGNPAVWQDMARRQVPGVQVTVVDYDTTPYPAIMRDILSRTDILVDATQRPDPGQVVVPNEWIGDMPEHAVLVDLSVDPYRCDESPISLKGIEGIPQGNLDQYIFSPTDPAYELLPECVASTHRRYTVSCYSWPGIHPKDCMDHYGDQLRPILRILIERGGLDNIRRDGRFFERAITRARLSTWTGG